MVPIMFLRDESGSVYEYTDCPMCENPGPHLRDSSGMLDCAICNTSFGTGNSPDRAPGPTGVYLQPLADQPLDPAWLPRPPEAR